MWLQKKMAAILAAATLLAAHLPATSFAASAHILSGSPTSAIESEVDRVMDKYIGKDTPGATVSVVQGGEIVLLKGYGLANVEKQQPMEANQTMEAGSISKVFTWTAVMQLVEQGKLTLDADIREYLPDSFLQLAHEQPITLLHLMSHTAGFEDSLAQLMVSDPQLLMPLEQRLGSGRQPQQIYEPGEVIAYSNFSTSLAGYIVERVSGMPFETYMQQHIFEPLGMENSSITSRYDHSPFIMDDKAIGYGKDDEAWKPYPNYYLSDTPAGALNTTAEDIARFMIAQLDTEGKAPYSLFTDSATLRAMHQTSFTQHPALPGNAHGFWERFAGPHRILEHYGNTKSFSSLLSLVPEKRFGVSILTNVENESAGVRREVVDALTGIATSQAAITSQLNHAQDVAGRYRSARADQSGPFKLIPVLADMDTIITAQSDGSLRLTRPFSGVDAIYVETEPYVFERITPERTMSDNEGQDISRLYFKTDADNRVTLLSYGTFADELPVSFLQTPSIQLLLAGSSAVTFLVGLLACAVSLLAGLLRRRSAAPLRAGTAWLSLVGLLQLMNLVAVLARLIADPFLPLTSLTFHTVLFWLLGAAALFIGYRLVRAWSSPGSTILAKSFVVLLAIAQLLFVFFLSQYNMYKIWIS